MDHAGARSGSYRQTLVSGLLFLLLLFVCGPARAGTDRVSIQSVETDFSQTRELRILARPLRSSGRLVFQSPDSLRWEYLHPVHSVLLLHNGVVKKYVDHNGTLVQEPGNGLDAMQVVLSEISNWLDGRFTDNKAFTLSRGADGLIILTPKKKGMRDFIQSIELKPGNKPGILESVTLREGPGSSTRFSFSNARLNQPVAAETFTVP